MSLLGVNVDNLSLNNINIDIDKAWNFVQKWAKGRKIDEILRYKVVNSIMSLTEQKVSGVVKQIYNKYAQYQENRKNEKKERWFKKIEEEKNRKEEEARNNPREIIKMKMKESLSQPKQLFQSVPKPKNKRKKFNNIKKETTKKIIKLDGYNNVEEIIEFIKNSKRNSQSKYCMNHYNNIKSTKNYDKYKEIMATKNEIIEIK